MATRFLMTPGFKAIDGDVADKFIHDARERLEAAPAPGGVVPDMIVGDPTCKTPMLEDDGATARIPFGGPAKVYAKLDHHRTGPVVTFLLPDEN